MTYLAKHDFVSFCRVAQWLWCLSLTPPLLWFGVMCIANVFFDYNQTTGNWSILLPLPENSGLWWPDAIAMAALGLLTLGYSAVLGISCCKAVRFKT